jgi:hypothetical protein
MCVSSRPKLRFKRAGHILAFKPEHFGHIHLAELGDSNAMAIHGELVEGFSESADLL